MVAALGNLSLDRVAGAAPRPGGTVFYSAGALAQTAVDARVSASCAPEDRAALLPELESFGLPVTWYGSRTTTAYSFHYEGDRRIMRQEAVGEPWSPEQAVEAVAGASWVHVGMLTRTDFPPETLAVLARDGRRLLVDAQGLLRTADLGPLRMDADIGDVLGYVHILKLNDEEAETLVGSAESRALQALGVPEVILTLGSQGSWVIAGEEIEHVRARDMAVSVDPTGAGDTFSAAYLAARATGLNPLDAAQRATDTVAVFLSGSRT
jgi:sugar/nucleoside kinase (ribokinase family)